MARPSCTWFLAALAIGGCASDAVAPDVRTYSGPVDAPNLSYTFSKGFPANAPDTTFLIRYPRVCITATDYGDCPTYDTYEIRATTLDAAGNYLDGRSLVDDYGGIGGWDTFPEPVVFLPFRPRDHTRESVNIEIYGTAWTSISGVVPLPVKIIERVGSYQHFWMNNGPNLLRWTPTSYPIAGVALIPAAPRVRSGSRVQLVAQAFAPNGVEIFDQPTSTWTSSNLGVAVLRDQGTQAALQYPGFTNWIDTVEARGAGVVTIATSLGGSPMSSVLTVEPASVISGPITVTTASSPLYTSTTAGCNSTCTYQWSMSWMDAISGAVLNRTLETNSYQAVDAPFSTHAFKLTLATTSNGVTGKTAYSVSVTPSSGTCKLKIGC